MSIGDFFRHPAVQLCVRVTRWIPVIFIVVVICWSYYAYVVELCIFTVESVVEKVLYLIPYHVVLFLFLWSYYQTTFAQILQPPKTFAVSPVVVEQLKQSTPTVQRQILERAAKDLPIVTRSFDGSIRYCEKCCIIKPDRSHHCAVCGICVLKMDHHCPWVNTCVHYNNYKYFVLFLGYALLFCLYVFLTDLQYFIKFWTDNYAKQGAGKFHIMFMFFVAGMFAVSVSSLFFYHLWLTAKNRSTLESFRPPVFITGPDKNGFNLGCAKNFRQVFGSCNPLAFLPVFTSFGDGTVYPTRPSLLSGGAGSTSSTVAEGRATTAGGAGVGGGGGYELNGVVSGPGSKYTESGNNNTTNNAVHGDGIRYPTKVVGVDEDQLLQRNHWTDDTEDSASDFEHNSPQRYGHLRSGFAEV